MPDDLEAAISKLVLSLMTALDALAYAGRHLHPPDLAELASAIAEFEAPLREARSDAGKVEWPDHLHYFRDQLLLSADEALEALEGIQAAPSDPETVLRAYRSLRHSTLAVEALYPLCEALPTVSRFFLEPSRRDDADLVARLKQADGDRAEVGVIHRENDREQRGGFSLYVPETYTPDRDWPVIVALHGGSGHGADFLWTWLREARTRGALLVSPSSVGRTWSLQNPAIDTARLDSILVQLRAQWRVDDSRVLLTGMSDGGTFSWLAGLRESGPFTHLAPISSSFHSLMLGMLSGVEGKPIYLTHGTLDWMFPVAMARAAAETLEKAGARVTFREIDDLSHTYPRDENPRILDWFLTDATPA